MKLVCGFLLILGLGSTTTFADEVKDLAKKKAVYNAVFDAISAGGIWPCKNKVVLRRYEASTMEKKLLNFTDGNVGYFAYLSVDENIDATKLYLYPGRQPVIVIENYFRNDQLSSRAAESFEKYDEVVTVRFSTNLDYTKILRVSRTAEQVVDINKGSLIDPKVELGRVQIGDVIECSTP